MGLGVLFTAGKWVLGKLSGSPGSPVLDGIRSVAQHFQQKQDNELTFKIEETRAETALAVAQVRAGETSFKDEYAVGVVTSPYVLWFLVSLYGLLDAVIGGDPTGKVERYDLMISRYKQSIELLSLFPGWYTWGVFVPTISACLGIRGGRAGYRAYKRWRGEGEEKG